MKKTVNPSNTSILRAKDGKAVSLQKKVIGPQIIFLAVQLTILMFCFLGLGILSNARNNELSKLSASVGSRAVQIQKFFNNISINASYAAEKIQADMQKLTASKDTSAQELLQSEYGAEQFESAAMPDLINSLEYSGTSGAFIILDYPNADGSIPALYLRDTQPAIVNAKDMLLLRGAYLIARKYFIPLDSEWSFDQPAAANFNTDFYQKPMQAAQKNKLLKADQTGLWSGLFHLPSSTQNIITYTIPLKDQNGEPFGVFGFELNENLLIKNLPSDEIPYSGGLFALYKDTNLSGIPENAVYSGVFKSLLQTGATPIAEAGFSNAAVLSINVGNNQMFGIKAPLELYSPASIFASDHWSLIGMAPQNELLSVWYTTLEVLIISFSLALIIGLAGIFRSGSVFTRPVSALAKRIRTANPKEPLHLGRTNIAEIDDLTSALEKMSGDVAQAASRLSKIIGLVGLPLGGYEADFQNGIVYCTDSMFELFQMQRQNKENFIPLAEWQALLTDILNDKEENFEDIYRYNPTLKSVRWLRIKKAAVSPHMELGIIMDVSDEVIHQRQSEFERDYDLVTGFINKKAFLSRCTEIIDSDPASGGILLLSDLYSIHKFDPLGEYEPKAILLAAERFGTFRQIGAVVSRISSYEFAVYIHHYESLESILEFCRSNFFAPLVLERMDRQKTKFFFSVGTSLYPKDARKIEDLLALADFALNNAKKQPQKGLLHFDAEIYVQSGSMSQKQLVMETILSSKKLDILLAPIMDAGTGNIMGYDAHMNYHNPVIQTTDDIIALARMHNRLFELERLSLISVLSFIQQNSESLGECKIFFSSITNEILPEEEIKKMDLLYSNLYSNIVFSLSDTEHTDKQIFLYKNNALKARGIPIAIDRYGTMEASELLLLDLKPAFLRLDPSITQDVNLDANRHQLLQALLAYTSTRGIKTIATGIRTSQEFETLIKMGIDTISGPYLCDPVSSIITPNSSLAKNIRQKFTDANTYKFVLEDGEERFTLLLNLLPQGTQLTEREKSILLQICHGGLNSIISNELGISSNTLKTHIRNIYSKYNVRNRKELLMITESSGSPNGELTMREKEILKLIVLGKTNQEITSTLCISINTIRVHIWNICTKLGVKNRKDLMYK